MRPSVLITRPEALAWEFADQLRLRVGCGVPVVVSPLMRIERCGVLPNLKEIKTLIFTSRNGVEVFADITTVRDIPCVTVGEVTAWTARALGMQAVSGGVNAEELIAHIEARGIGEPCLHVRGEHGAVSIAARLVAAGIAAEEVVVYRQLAQLLNEQAQALLRRENPVIVPLMSPRSAKLFFEGDTGVAPVWVAAISQAAANAVPEGRAKQVLVAQRPEVNAVLDTVEALMDNGKSLEGRILAQ